MNIVQIYEIEGKNPWSIRRWLKAEGFDEKIIDLALGEHAQNLADGKRFGYDKNTGISHLSKSIRNRVIELTEMRESELAINFGRFSPSEFYWMRLWYLITNFIKDLWELFCESGKKGYPHSLEKNA